MRACQHCGGQHLDVECAGEDDAVVPVGLPAGMGRRRRRGRPSVWSEGMRVCQHCAGKHLDTESAGEDEDMQKPVAVRQPSGMRSSRRRALTWSEGMLPCRDCGGSHLDGECEEEQLAEQPTAKLSETAPLEENVCLIGMWVHWARAVQVCKEFQCDRVGFHLP
eukprot:TRINITY_DN10029_c0_g1_i2.p3 TRINITY_DN10029_c0_g1~~TRINITY_DN10029_c0_g1_i2.p3  ORF type:complete len:164 (+),score=19.39 TRINITY_DN10029_c0_g1_i2:529-1020(+)